MKNDEIIIALKEQFAKECEVIELRYEYGKDYTGTEKYGIITGLSEKELVEKYEAILSEMTPYVLLPPKYAIIRCDFRKNDKKFEMRYLRGHYYPIDDEFEEHHPECCVADFVKDILSESDETQLLVRKAFAKLTDIQKDVVCNHVFLGKSLLQISKELGKNEKTVRESYAGAIKKMKKFLKTPPNFAHPSGNKSEGTCSESG